MKPRGGGRLFARRALVIAAATLLLVLGPVACRSSNTVQDKVEAIAQREQKMAAKLEVFRKRQAYYAGRIKTYEKRLAQLRQRREVLEHRIASRTPHVIRPGQVD